MSISVKIVLFLAWFALFAWAFHVSDEDIAACVKGTGWSKERCAVELTR